MEYKTWTGETKPAELFWEVQAAEAQARARGDETPWEHILRDRLDTPKLNAVIFGGTGGLGTQLAPLLSPVWDVWSVGRADVDIQSADAVLAYLKDVQPHMVVNMVAFNTDTTIQRMIEQQLNPMLDTNVRGSTNILNATVRYFRESGRRGCYTYVSSILAERPVRGAGLYSASKAFQESLTCTAAMENARAGLRCNNVRLGYFKGGLTDKLPTDLQQSLTDKIPLGVLGDVKYLAQTLQYLYTNEYMTGATLRLDGGMCLS